MPGARSGDAAKIIAAFVPSKSPETVVVMAHGTNRCRARSERQRERHGRADRARQGLRAAADEELSRRHLRPQDRLFLSTDGGAFGGLGAAHFLKTSPLRKRIVAVINLDAIAGPGKPAIEIGGDTPRSPNASLVATTVARVAEQTGAARSTSGSSDSFSTSHSPSRCTSKARSSRRASLR